MMTALLVTFLSGTSTGFLVGRNSTPPPVQKTWIDGAIDQLREKGVTKEADLENARSIYENFQGQVMELKGRVNELFRDRLTALENDAERQIQEIMDSAVSQSAGAKEK
jgi:lysozyme family protein